MIYKVWYQKNRDEIPVRENTDALFIEASSEKEVRQKLAKKNYIIEYIEPVSEAYLEYEKKTNNFKLENI